MSATNAYDQPLSVEVVDGEVVIRSAKGPLGVSLTPKAAAETAQAIATAAQVAADHEASQGAQARD